jgi:hypothetical protein
MLKSILWLCSVFLTASQVFAAQAVLTGRITVSGVNPTPKVALSIVPENAGYIFQTIGTLSKDLNSFHTTKIQNGVEFRIVQTREGVNVQEIGGARVFSRMDISVRHFRVDDTDKTDRTQKFSTKFVFGHMNGSGIAHCMQTIRWPIGSKGFGFYLNETYECSLQINVSSQQGLDEESIRDLKKFILHRVYTELGYADM